MFLSASTWNLYTCTRLSVQSGISYVFISFNMITVHMYTVTCSVWYLVCFISFNMITVHMYTVSCSIWYFVCYYQLQHGNCTHVHGLLFSLVFRVLLSAATWKLYTCARSPVQSGISCVIISFNMETVHMYTVSCSVWYFVCFYQL